ncbi:MAG: tyrosine--tRNA ligase [Candidatus Omnitrophota bacterium]
MDINKQLEIIKRGAVEIISEEELKAKLEKSIRLKKPLIVKAGFDPTAPDIHLGHTVLLRKMRQFQDLGHRVIFLIGDFTAQIGDPSGRSEKRKQLTREEVKRNAATYKKQVSKVLNINRLKIFFNSRWFARMSATEILRLTTHATVSQILAREDFKKRLSNKEDVSLLEIMYPIMQGYDSVKLEADIELGGTDQTFNLLMGREMQKDSGFSPQVVITMPLLEGTDGVQKMSKSFANYIGINEMPDEMFGKVMSISDELMLKYYTLLTDEDIGSVKQMHPKEAKLRLAEIIVCGYHSAPEAKKARNNFEDVFSKKELPSQMPEYRARPNENIVSILISSGLVKSGNEARRLIKEGAITFEEEKVTSIDFTAAKPGILKVGTRRFLRIIP